jgi:putative SOS response-associated peptidase YedK
VCGRYYSLFDKQQIAEHFHVRRTGDNVGIIAPNYNAAPGDFQPVIRRSRDTGERELVMMRWGIVPRFAKTEDQFKALSTINAKSDNLTSSRMWRKPFAKRRCLVPASGLYEWPMPAMPSLPRMSLNLWLIPKTLRQVPVISSVRSRRSSLRREKAPKPIKRVFRHYPH